MKIVHFSDIHFGTEIPEVVEGLAARIHELGPDLIIASGDFTMAARHTEFRGARAFIDRLPVPVLATPGNHDMPVYNLIERFFKPFDRYNKYIEPITTDRFASDEVAILSLNSARPWDLSFDWSHGRLSDKQIVETDRYFETNRNAPFKALVVHHPFYVPEDLPGFRTIRNGEEMLRVLARHGVHAILTGHLHRQFTTTRNLELEAGIHDITLLQVATAASSRHRDQPNAFAVIETDGDSFDICAEIWNGSEFVTEMCYPPTNAENTNKASRKNVPEESETYTLALNT